MRFAALPFTAVVLAGCTEVQRPTPEPYLATTTPPVKQEFRWSNGRLPKSIDPARAAAAPETDLVRAVFEGLTSLDPNTLEARPALAEKFTSSDDKKTWTFHLRKNARWSNGKRVTADDLVASWARVLELGDKAPHFDLAKNVVGFRRTVIISPPSPTPVPAPLTDSLAPPIPLQDVVTAKPSMNAAVGVRAVDETTLEVKLEYPDANFPKLVADPIFRPVYAGGNDTPSDDLDKRTITNGPFKIAEVAKDGVLLERSETYWNRAAVKLDGVRFVAAETAEAALQAYKRGEVDAVTNAGFEPLALKLLTPYDDFRRTPHSALNFYEFNTTVAPFTDRRVRAALSYAIDRTKLAEAELEGAAFPADRVLPFGEGGERIVTDADTAKSLLGSAGFANGDGFPVIRLIVNRNDAQQRLARAIARMWRQTLNLETEITVKESGEMDAVRASGDFDLIRRNVVLPSADEFVSLTAVYGSALRPVLPEQQPKDTPRGPADTNVELPFEPTFEPMNESDLLYDSRVIPLYFPVSYSLVRGYVTGFEPNAIDAVELGDVGIDTNWQPKR
jgi:oligopeptide transport system substrate-binding protein